MQKQSPVNEQSLVLFDPYSTVPADWARIENVVEIYIWKVLLNFIEVDFFFYTWYKDFA